MSEVLQANIFFFITSVSVVLVTILLVAVLFYVLGILRNVKEVTDRIKEGSRMLAQDFSQAREAIKREGKKTTNIISFFLDRFEPKKRRASRKKKAGAQ